MGMFRYELCAHFELLSRGLPALGMAVAQGIESALRTLPLTRYKGRSLTLRLSTFAGIQGAAR